MSSYDSGCNSLTKEVSEPSIKTFHYVSLPRVVLERIDEKLVSYNCASTKMSSDTKQVTPKKSLTKPVSKILSNETSPLDNCASTKKSSDTKQVTPKKSLTKQVSKILSNEISPRTNTLPEKRRIKLTNKSEDILHICNFRSNSDRQFIMADAVSSVKHNNETVTQNQSVETNSKPTQKPFLTVRSKTEINNLVNKKQNNSVMLQEKRENSLAHPIVQLKKLENIVIGDKVFEHSQNTGRELPSHSYSMKKNMLVTQNKQVDVADGIKHDRKIEKGSPSKLQINTNLQSKQNELSPRPTNSCTEKQKVITVHVNKNVQSKQNEINALKQLEIRYEKAETGVIQINKNLQNKPNQISPNSMKHSMTQVNKISQQNKKTEEVSLKTVKQTFGSEKQSKIAGALGHPYNENGISHGECVASSMQNISVIKEMFPNSTPGTSILKRKMPSEHDYHNTKLQKICETSAGDSAGTSSVSSFTGFINNTKDPPDRRTAKVTPMAKARKSITLPKPDTVKVTENNKLEWTSNTSKDNIEAVTLLSQLVGKPIAADKMEVLLRRECDNRHISITKSTSLPPPSKKCQGQGVSHISKLLADSVNPSTQTAAPIVLIPTPSLVTTTSVTTTTTSITTTPVVVNTMASREATREDREILAPTSYNPTLTNASAILYNKTPGPVNISTCTTRQEVPENSVDVPCGSVTRSDSITQQIVTNNFVDAITENNATKQKSLPPPQLKCDNLIPKKPSHPKTIYDVVSELSALYPAWNMHILQDTNTFCIAHVARSSYGLPIVTKCIELDEQFNGKVYIHDYHCKQFDGTYSDEQSILGLFNRVDALKPGSRR